MGSCGGRLFRYLGVGRKGVFGWGVEGVGRMDEGGDVKP